ncbi:MAG: CDP-diacylglycerol---serine O-phosphatidyltransferase [Candidatus Ordinivivax streblomastigis]|uniref:CDP-diacylglycerol--serine O-phosphatidyltransferase n=1 Tax=Candidatus Ordinivivax streblomastigis TaxID=2540710 RepID=A0A5M8P0G2_9BACT|nr:MAG: CDP-diacylglycerol---serine O-phosphatidyltransferase [Candidatus Ordinivivax streblomastigis]
MNFIKYIPNTITCLNLLSGCMACVMALRFDNYTGAFLFIILAAIFDFLDGFAARLLKAYSNIGAELDSLADVISFGLAPGTIVYSYLIKITEDSPFALAGFLLPVFAALRLAKFNVDTRQTTSFLGLPVPSSALFWAALIPTIYPYSQQMPILCTLAVVVLVLAFCGLMVSEIPMFSLKFKSFAWKGNQKPYMLIGISTACIVLFFLLGLPMLSVSLIILIYILMSLIE